MNYLLDTHTFIWWDNNPEKLSTAVLEICKDTSNQLFLSVASIWEMQIKHQLGKLTFDTVLENLIRDQVNNNDMQILPVKPSHIFALGDLPDIHKDPFDRLLISQARYETMTLLSIDQNFKHYPINVYW